MALSSDEIIKREIVEELGTIVRDLRLRIFPEGSNDDQRLFTKGGLTFSYAGVDYGSCDAGWFIKKNNQIIPYIGLEGTDALNRGSSGNAQFQRFHHALGAVKNGIIGVYYLKRGIDKIQPDLYSMALSATKHEKGTYLIIDDLDDIKPLILHYDDNSVVKKTIGEIIDKMSKISSDAFNLKYKGSLNVFANKRSTIIMNDKVIKYAGRMIRNFTESSQRAGHIAVGEMYLTKYYFYGRKIYYLMPKMTRDDIEYLDKHKGSDKEWYLLRHEPDVEMKSMDDLEGLPQSIRNRLLDIRLEPLKGYALMEYNDCMKMIVNLIKGGKIFIR